MGANRVIPGLWQGGAPPIGCELDFDLVVLCAEEYQPRAECGSRLFGPRADVLYAPFDDSGRDMTEAERHTALSAAKDALLAFKIGKRVLVTCYQGRNRSGLVVSLMLVMLGDSPRQAVAKVRLARGANAMANSHHVRFLEQVGRALSERRRAFRPQGQRLFTGGSSHESR